jgi:hypothetical protein
LNNDGLFDAVIGNYSGGVSLFYGDSNVSTSDNISEVQPAFEVYPVPAGKLLTIESSLSFPAEKYSITDQCGRIVSEGAITSNKTEINCGELSAGVYLCTVHFSNGMRSSKTIIIE